MDISWSDAAIGDLTAIGRYIERDNPNAAKMILRRIQDAAEALVDQPGIGRFGRINNTREFVVERTPYIIPYRVVGGRIVILRVYHTARQWPERF